MSTYLESLVGYRIQELGEAAAAKFFGVSEALIRQWANGSKRPSLAAVERVFTPPEGPTEGANWDAKEVMLCLPSYKTTNPVTAFSLLGIWDREKFGCLLQHGDAFIIHTRENIAQRFLDSGKPWSLWVDDDMVIPMGNAEWFRKNTGIPMSDEFAGLHTANRLLSHGKTLVGALYFGRHPWGRAMYHEALMDSPDGVEENRRAHAAPVNSLRPTKWTGTGCILIHRDVFLDIRANNPHLEPMFGHEAYHYFTNASDGAMSRFDLIQETVTQATAAAESEKPVEATKLLKDAVKLLAEAKLDVLQNSHNQQGEDQTFCIRARKVGHQSYTDLGLVCGHIGTAVYGPHNTSGIPSPQHQHN